ncbi:hypothetical protein RFI_39188, partial [Reticulomyxa filosa]
VEISCPDQKKPLLFCSFYRNLQCKTFNFQAFEQELQSAMNAHHPAWLDQNTDDVSECILDFITSNGLRLKKNIDNWMQSIDPNVLGSTETLDKAVESWTKRVVDAGEATIGIKYKDLFTQFKALNNNKICIIPALVNKETNSVAKSDAEKAYLLAKTFAEPPQPPKDVDEKHYETVEEDIRFKVAISKPLELDESCM